ncbi:MAG TPA: CDP-diacylglycerol diphosphatase [Steroidobacteraceae bacterium]|jgi:CDP-diacylglycerol pyrophosphatase
MIRVLLVAAAALVLGALLHFGLALANPDSLWNIVHEHCVPDQSEKHDPGECRLVDLSRHYAILKDMRGASHYLLLPTDALPGIESPLLLGEDAPNFWEAAWQARRYVEESVGRKIPREDLGLSINSARRRSQNQLHIHIDCVRPEIRDGLSALESEIGDTWSGKPVSIAGSSYYVRRVRSADLLSADPFRLLAARLKDPVHDMADQALSVVGVRFQDHTEGFYLLDSPYGSNGAASDDVLDRSCRVLDAVPASANGASS